MAKSSKGSADNTNPAKWKQTYADFQPLDKLLVLKNLPDSKVKKELAVGYDLAGIRKRLANAGFRRASKTIHSGTTAIVLEVNDDLMIRIAPTQFEAERPKSDDILQPIGKIATKPVYRVEILPKVDTLLAIKNNPELQKCYGITGDVNLAIEGFVKRLVSDNLQKKEKKFFFDINLDNVALLKDADGKAVPIILDPHAVLDIDKISDIDDKHILQFVLHATYWYPEVFVELQDYIAEHMKGRKSDMSRHIKCYLKELESTTYETPLKYAEAQKINLANHPLAHGSTGIIDSNELTEGGWEQRPTFARMVKEDKLYRREIGEIVKLAIAEMEKAKPLSQKAIQKQAREAVEGELPANEKGFCQMIAKQAEKHRQEMSKTKR